MSSVATLCVAVSWGVAAAAGPPTAAMRSAWRLAASAAPAWFTSPAQWLPAEPDAATVVAAARPPRPPWVPDDDAPASRVGVGPGPLHVVKMTSATTRMSAAVAAWSAVRGTASSDRASGSTAPSAWAPHVAAAAQPGTTPGRSGPSSAAHSACCALGAGAAAADDLDGVADGGATPGVTVAPSSVATLVTRAASASRACARPAVRVS